MPWNTISKALWAPCFFFLHSNKYTQFNNTDLFFMTILFFFRIIVLSHGQILEYDSPKALARQQGEFYKMLRDAGLSITTD